ncbi:hypothetical protein BY458DRAFT_416137, partial [Sporodiniella umbellata]
RLSTGRVVDDEMKKLAQNCVYEHPVHSMILEPDDPIWKNYFSEYELLEIKTHCLQALPPLSEAMEVYLSKYDQDWKSGEELYEFADSQKHHPIIEFDKKWVRESFIRASELFLYQDVLYLNGASESDLLHNIWPFVYRIFKDQNISASLGEKSSVAVALGRNEERCLETVNKRSRKKMGAKVDVLFKVCKKELGSCEVGLDDVTIVDDKYLDNGLMKLPKVLRDMLAILGSSDPTKINELRVVGFLMM